MLKQFSPVKLAGTVIVAGLALLLISNVGLRSRLSFVIAPLERLLIKGDFEPSKTTNPDQLLAENIQLKQLLTAYQQEKTASVMGIQARVIGFTPNQYRRQIRISLPHDAPIKVGQAVTVQGSLIGLVETVEGQQATVQLINDPNFKAVGRTNDGSEGLIQGRLGAVLLTQVQRSAKLKAGDVVLTSGLDGRLPTGLPLAIVLSVFDEEQLLKQAQLKPLVDLTSLRVVTIVEP